MKVCCIIGHRPKGLNKFMKYGDFNDIPFMDYNDYMYVLVIELMKEGYSCFVSGGAIGVDIDFAEAVLYAKNYRNKNILLEMALPCKNQNIKWRKQDKERYVEILNEADKVVLVSENYTLDCMKKRNEYMVEKADLIVAFWNGEEKGGTWNTIQYARIKKKELRIIKIEEIIS